MPNLTLASGQITRSDQHDLDSLAGRPAVTDPRKFGTVANAVVAILAEAKARLAMIKAGEM